MSFLERDGLKLKQGEWNILQMGTTKYETNCKQLRFKDVYLETTHLPAQKTIPLMTDLIIDVSLLADPSPWSFLYTCFPSPKSLPEARVLNHHLDD